MHKTADKYNVTPRLVIVTSDVHYHTTIPKAAVKAPRILHKMSEKEFCTKSYVSLCAPYIARLTLPSFQCHDVAIFAVQASVIWVLSSGSMLTPFTVLTVMFVRALAEHSSSKVIVNGPNPAFCVSDLRRDMKGFMAFLNTAGEKMLAYTTEEGSRQYVWAAVGGSKEASPSEPEGMYTNDQLHGQYTSASKVQEVADYVLSAEGTAVQARIWVRVLLTMPSSCL